MYGGQQWSCDVCTYKQSATAQRCAMCGNPNPFMIGSNQSATYFQPQRAPPKPKPVVKESLRYQCKPRKNGEFGKIIYQTDRISKQQVLDTYSIYLLNKDIKTSSWPLYVFGENDIDKVRPKGGERDMIGGLAGVLGDYDTSVSFGVTTTFYKNKSVNKDFKAFKKIINDDFDKLLEYIKCGHDIIVPSPNMQDLHGYYEKSYWKVIDNEKKQVIFHNIGTGLACIPFNYIEYIQKKFDILKQIGDKNTVDIGDKEKDVDNNNKDKDDNKDATKDNDDANNNNADDKNKKKDDDDNNNNNDKPPPKEQEVNKQQEANKEQQANNQQINQQMDADEALAKALAMSMQQK